MKNSKDNTPQAPDRDKPLFEDASLDEHDPLWNLLGKAPAPQASDFFARNVQRQIRLNEELPQSTLSTFLTRLFQRPRTIATLSGCAALLLGFLALKSGSPADLESSPDVASQSIPLPEFDSETIAQSTTIIETVIAKEELSEMEQDMAELGESVMAIASQDPSILLDQDLLAYLY